MSIARESLPNPPSGAPMLLRCAYPGCSVNVPPQGAMCPRHWSKLPRETQLRIEALADTWKLAFHLAAAYEGGRLWDERTGNDSWETFEGPDTTLLKKAKVICFDMHERHGDGYGQVTAERRELVELLMWAVGGEVCDLSALELVSTMIRTGYGVRRFDPLLVAVAIDIDRERAGGGDQPEQVLGFKRFFGGDE